LRASPCRLAEVKQQLNNSYALRYASCIVIARRRFA